MNNKYLVSEALAEAFLLQQGYEVARPVDPRLPYDLLYRRSRHFAWYLAQVKTAYQDGGRWVFNACRNTATGREEYQQDEVDTFIVVDPRDSTIYEVPWHLATPSRMRLDAIPKECIWQSPSLQDYAAIRELS